MNRGLLYVFGILTGVTAVGVAVYVGAPGIARKVASRASATALGRIGTPVALATTASNDIGEIAANEARGAIFS